MITFDYPMVFLLLPLPYFIYRFVPSYLSKQRALKVPFFALAIKLMGLTPQSGAKELTPRLMQKFSIAIGWILLIIAAAKPIWLMEPQTIERSGRDLMLVLDLSGSMATQDFVNASGENVSRLSMAKEVLADFSHQRDNDRLGLILFGDSAFLQAPFTIDHQAWNQLLNQTDVAMAGESTHLGDAIGLGIKTFLEQESKTKQRVMIVLTDGNDTNSLVPPIDAAKVAAFNNIRVHTIAIGSSNTSGDEAINMSVLEEVAHITQGDAFLAYSQQDLQKIYKKIDQLEQSVFESFTYQQRRSLHHIPIAIMFGLHLLFMMMTSLKNGGLLSSLHTKGE